MPEISDDLLDDARKLRPAAVSELLAMHYAMVWRIATGLTGREDVGRGIATYIMKRSLRAIPTWKDDAAPQRWFAHHTLLAARRTTHHQPELEHDTLLTNAKNEIPLLAFVRALRILPLQQREAFILSRFENFGPRQMATAMDCSVVAAETHLEAADRQLMDLADAAFAERVAHLKRIYMSHAPDEPLTLTAARKQVARLLTFWKIWRFIRAVLLFLFLIAFVIGSYFAWRIIEHSWPR